jgi:CBS domain-containing protein
MATDVAYATERSPDKELVRLLAERRASAVPVGDAKRRRLPVADPLGRLVGIVRRSDLQDTDVPPYPVVVTKR